jgi:hypothetical protein
MCELDRGPHRPESTSASGNALVRRRAEPTRSGSRAPLRPADDHIDLPAAAAGAHKPLAPPRNTHLGAVPLGHLGRVGLDLTAAPSTPTDPTGPRPWGVPERHRRAAAPHRRRRLTLAHQGLWGRPGHRDEQVQLQYDFGQRDFLRDADRRGRQAGQGNGRYRNQEGRPREWNVAVVEKDVPGPARFLGTGVHEA